MTKLTKKDVLRVASLSNLKLSDKEIKKFLPQLSKIVEFINNLSEVDTLNVEPTTQTTGLVNVFRDDVVKSQGSLNQDQALSGTENTHSGYFKVPAILSERSTQ